MVVSPANIADRLRADLVGGTFRPGAELLQVDLARRFGVSRIPVRDALRTLAGDGLVEMTANRGARVVELSKAEIRELYDLRMLLECDCLRRAAAMLTPADLREIERARQKSDIDSLSPNWSAGDWAFHRSIYCLANRPRQLALIERLRQTCEIHVRAHATLPARRPRWLADHQHIVEHLGTAEIEKAVEELRSHLERAAEHLIGRIAA